MKIILSMILTLFALNSSLANEEVKHDEKQAHPEQHHEHEKKEEHK